jgi:hypothetical protein
MFVILLKHFDMDDIQIIVGKVIDKIRNGGAFFQVLFLS